MRFSFSLVLGKFILSEVTYGAWGQTCTCVCPSITASGPARPDCRQCAHMYHDSLHVVLESDVCVSVCDSACAHLTASVVWEPTLPLATEGPARKALYGRQGDAVHGAGGSEDQRQPSTSQPPSRPTNPAGPRTTRLPSCLWVHLGSCGSAHTWEPTPWLWIPPQFLSLVLTEPNSGPAHLTLLIFCLRTSNNLNLTL